MKAPTILALCALIAGCSCGEKAPKAVIPAGGMEVVLQGVLRPATKAEDGPAAGITVEAVLKVTAAQTSHREPIPGLAGDVNVFYTGTLTEGLYGKLAGKTVLVRGNIYPAST
jgi:hypothetical protein